MHYIACLIKARMESDSESSGSPVERFRALPGAKSKVWQYFGFVVDGSGTISNKTHVTCVVCEKTIRYCGNTTNLSYHLKQYHPEEFSKTCTGKQGSSSAGKHSSLANQSSITEYLTKATPYKHNSHRYKTCENALVEFICLDFQPISIVESPSFLKYSKTLDQLYQPASRTHFTRVAIPRKYEEVKRSVLASLSRADYISFTTDMWTAIHHRAYITVTVHYISPEMQMRHHTLCTQEISVAHSAENLADEIGRILEDWGLSEKLYGATTDNARNIRNAVVDIMQVMHLGCVGHTLQLSVHKAFVLTPVARLIGKVKKLVEHFRKSTKETYALREKQALLQIPEHELVQQCDTRWNSTLYMLQRVRDLQPALCAVLMENKEKHICALFPDGAEWDLLEELVSILQPFEEATKAMSGSNYPTISMLSPLIYQLCKVTLKVNDGDSTNLQNIKEAMLEDFEERYSSPDIANILNVAAFIDPRFKELDPFVPVADRNDVKTSVKLELLEVAADFGDTGLDSTETSNTCTAESDSDHLNQSSESRSSSSNKESDTDEPIAGPSNSKKPRTGPVSSLFNGITWPKQRKQLSRSQLVESELRRYQDEESIDLDANPLVWWNSRLCQYPLLIRLVRKIWSHPATSVCSEQVFSAAGNVVTKKRARLLGENVDKLVFLNRNINQE